MKNRLLLYYSLLVPGLLVFFFGPALLQLLTLLFFVLATVELPYSDRFLEDSLKKLPAFVAVMLVVWVAFFFMIDFVIFLSGFSSYFSLLVFIPLYLMFRMISLPWVFIWKGIIAPVEAFKVPAEVNWTVLAAFSFLAMAYTLLPLSLPFLAAPVSILVRERLPAQRIKNL